MVERWTENLEVRGSIPFIGNMQQVYALLYLSFYTLTLILLLVFFFEYIVEFNIQTVYLTKFSIWTQQYTSVSYIYSLILIAFSGLPPTMFFFIKFQIIVNYVVYWDFFISILIFVFFFINMVFYLQFFKFKTQWLYLHELFKKTKTKLFKLPNRSYNVRYFLHFNLFILFFSIFIFQDLVIIFTNFNTCYVRYI